MNTKGKEARFVADALIRAGVTPWIVDLSLKAHTVGDADLAGANVAAAAGVSWQMLNERTRQDAAAVMTWLGNYCQGNAAARLADATVAFVRAHRP